MTKFVLHGGFNKEKGFVQEDDEFFKEILKSTSGDVKILLVYFAEREDIVGLRIDQDQQQFNKNKELKNLQFKVASEEAFVTDCAWADVIYLHGGRTIKLMEVLKKYQNLERVFSERIIAADSAGVNVLGQLSYSKNSKEIRQGLKVLPYKIVVHYTDGAPNPLAHIEPSSETIFLHEYETKVVYL